MVSIPDWPKLQRLHDAQKEPSNLATLDRYYKQREEETIRQAETQGLLRTATQDFLINNCAALNGKHVKDVSQLRLVRLCGVHLRKIGDLNYCINLQICVLNNNYLTKIDALAPCRQLIKLDLHSNQLTNLPGIAFWSGMRRLKFLHLHDNPLGKYENFQNLATCPSLVALTMYDTPLSLKRNYRHHVVNSIWSLKALDHHVISDEEIIEDAMFGGHFSTKHQSFRISLYFNTPQESSFEDEMELMKNIEIKINRIMAHHSPVLIVQKYIRGHLTRKKLTVGRKNKIKSAGGTTLPIIPPDMVPPPPSSSPVFEASHTGSHDNQSQDMGEGVSMDYDTYLKSKRPDSSLQSEDQSYQRKDQTYQVPYTTPLDSMYDESGTVISPDILPKKKTNLMINLAKLQTGTFSSLYDEQIAVETVLSAGDKSDRTDKKKKKKKKEKSPQRKVVKSVKQFFGPVVESEPKSEEPEPSDEDEDVPVTQYRLRGYQPNIIFIDPTTEMILSKQEAGRVVRDAEVEHHRRLQEMPPPKPKLPKKTVNNEQRLYRAHGNMGMSCLFAVHQAYKDREKAERTATKMEHILTMREERERAKERIKIYHDEKRSNALKQRDIERARMLELLERREMLRLNYLDKRQELKSKSTDLTKTFRADYTFITEFSNQHTSVSNALMRHDRQAKFEDQLNMKSNLVQGYLAAEQEQQDVVKKYLEHRQLMRQTESAMARSALDTRMLQEANDRLMEAKTRVAQQKARKDRVQTFYPLPVMTPLPTASSAPPMIAHGLSRWETNVLINHGRVGKHHTMVQ